MKKRVDLIDRLKAGLIDLNMDPNTATLKDIVQKCLTAEEGREMKVAAITNVIYENYSDTIYAEVEVNVAKGAPSRRRLMWQKKSEILNGLGLSFEKLKKSFREDKKYWNGKYWPSEEITRKEKLLQAFKDFDETLEAAGVWRLDMRDDHRSYAVRMMASLINNWKAWKDEHTPIE